MQNRPYREWTEEETSDAEAAYAEFQATGTTSRRCPDCGGSLTITDGRSSYSVICQNSPPCLYRYTVRGI